MPTIRKIPLVNRQIYHVFNRGIDKRITFTSRGEYLRAYRTIKFYQNINPPMKFSNYLKLTGEFQKKLDLKFEGGKLVSIFAYCLMPNHFHFLLRQETDSGISKFIGQFLNSYTRYFNTKHKRVGGLFLDQFKNTLVCNENQFLHVSRYIHLNPYSSNIVKNFHNLIDYEWSSLREYIDKCTDDICSKEVVMASFKNNKDVYKKFVLEHAEYQKELKEMEE